MKNATESGDTMAESKAQQQSATGAVEASELDSLLTKEFRPKTDEA